MPPGRLRYFILYKPFGILSQFTPEGKWNGLGSLGAFPKDVYPVGRLDVDSEGLLLLTNDSAILHHLTDPKFGHERTYLALVEGVPGEPELSRLRKGISVRGKKTLPAIVRVLPSAPVLPDRTVPIRFRKNIPTTWLEIILTEGRNRQVRRMTAAVGHPTLRLVRISQGPIRLTDLQNAGARELTADEIQLLKSVVDSPELSGKRRSKGRRRSRQPARRHRS